VLHAFDGKCAFGDASLKKVQDLKSFYELDLDASASHRLKESKKARAVRKEGGAR